MAVLTWRNVEAPSFRDSADGIRIAGAMFDRAAGNLSQGLGQFQDWRQNQTAGALLNNAQGFTDPEELRKAIASGAIFNGMDRSLVTPQALAALNSQTKTLLDQGVTAENLRFSKEINPYKITETDLTTKGLALKNEHDILNNPLLRAQTRAGTASSEATTARTVQMTEQEAKLFPEKFRGQELSNDSTRANIDQTKQMTEHNAKLFPAKVGEAELGLNRGQWGFNNDKTAFADNKAASDFVAKVNQGAMTEPDAAAYLGTPEFANLPSAAKVIVVATIQARFNNKGSDLYGPNAVGGIAPTSASSVGTGASLPTSVAPTTVAPTTVGAATPASASVLTGSAPASGAGNSTGYTSSAFVTGLPFKETQDYVQKVLNKTGNLTGLSVHEQAKRIMPNLISTESGGDPNAVNKKSGATGLTQILPSTFDEMKKNYAIEGPITDPKSNVKAGEMYLRELLTLYKGDPEKALAAYNMGMGKLKTHLDNTGNSGSTPNTINPATEISQLTNQVRDSARAAEIARQGLETVNSQNNAASYIANYADDIVDTKLSVPGAIARLQKLQAYAGTPYAILQNSLELMMKQKGPGGVGNINAATAARILEDSTIPPDKFDRNFPFGVFNYSKPNDKVALEKAKLIALGTGADARINTTLTQELSQKVSAAETSLKTANSQYIAALKRVPALSPETLGRYRAEVALAQASLDRVLETQQGDKRKPKDDPANMFSPRWGQTLAPEVLNPSERFDRNNFINRGVIPRVKVE